MSLVERRLLLTAPLGLIGAAEHVPVAARPISRLDTPWWRDRHEAILARLRQGHVDLLWIGDSITQDWEHTGPQLWNDFAPVWRHFYGDRNAVNLGFKGDNTAHLLWRLRNGEVDGIAPRIAIVLIGANDMGRVHWTADQTVAGIDACMTELLHRLPATRFVLLSVLPSLRNDYVTATTVQINRMLATKYGAGMVAEVAYVDVSGIFLRDGRVDPAQFLDVQLSPPEPPLHPTAQAQTRIAESIEPIVAKILGGPSKARPVL